MSSNLNLVMVCEILTPLGTLLAGANDAGLCLLEFTTRHKMAEQLAAIEKHVGPFQKTGTNKHLQTIQAELPEYFAGQRREFSVPLVHPGTDFQIKVWNELTHIPYGETRSYQDLAMAVGNPKSVRAVGQTNGRNRIAIVVPCHRVVNKSGTLGGYAGGLDKKQFLLNLEARYKA